MVLSNQRIIGEIKEEILKVHRRDFPGGSVKNLPAIQETQETQVPSLGWEDPLEKSMATHSSILTWRIPWIEELGGVQSIGLQRVRHN